MSIVRQIVDGWASKFRKYFFFYRDGFYEFPYLANSPDLMLESLLKMPFIDRFPEQNYYETKNIFFNGVCHYEELEEGLWLIMSDLEIKKNVSFKLIYDNRLPKDYHFLTLHVSKSITKIPKINAEINNEDQSWTFFKAGASALNTHFKGEKSIFFSIYFSEQWLEKNISENGMFDGSSLKEFLNSEDDCLFLPKFMEEKKGIYLDLIKSLTNKDDNGVKNLLSVKINTLAMLSYFIEKINSRDTLRSTFHIKESDARKLKKAEKILEDKVFEGFPGVGPIAKSIGMSETVLKTKFKKVYGNSLFQYYRTIQMNQAEELIKNTDQPIKNIAYTFGYANSSKFSTAFAKVKGCSPSDLR